MERFFLGGDVSKGYSDFHLTDEAGLTLPGTARYDDTPAGHAAMRNRCLQLLLEHPHAELLVGLEASGGLERNWLRTFRALFTTQRGRVYQLNPLAVKRYLERDLHRNITDPRSARGIAEYLREGLRPADQPFEPRMEGPLALYRFTCNTIDRCTQVKNELHSLLPSVHPYLVPFCQKGFPDWVLKVIASYPTADALKRARPTTLARIPYVTFKRAGELIQAAKTSVAALRDPHIAVVVRSLTKEITRLEEQVATLKRQLGKELQHDPEVQLCVSIPGIGVWTAVALRLECGTLTRFHSEAAITAFAGLNPRRHQSGDTEKQAHISRRGRKELRAALFMATMTAVRVNPPIRAFYHRLRGEGKEHMVAMTACMAKLLRIAYACVMSGTRFDPQRYAQIQERHRQRQEQLAELVQAESAPAPVALETPSVGSLTAPVSRREAKRRRAATMPQAGGPQLERGPGAALVGHDSQGLNGAQSSAIQLSESP